MSPETLIRQNLTAFFAVLDMQRRVAAAGWRMAQLCAPGLATLSGAGPVAGSARAAVPALPGRAKAPANGRAKAPAKPKPAPSGGGQP